MFDWIRKSVKNAVLAGINDAVAEVVGATGPAIPEVPEVRLMLPAPAVVIEEGARKARKGGA